MNELNNIKEKALKIWYAIGLLVLTFIILWILSNFKNILALLIICTLLSYLLMPVVDFFSHPLNIKIKKELGFIKWKINLPFGGKTIKTSRGLPRIAAISLTFIIFGTCIMLILLWVMPLISQEMQNLYANRKVYKDNITRTYDYYVSVVEKYTPNSFKPYIKVYASQFKISDINKTVRDMLASTVPVVQGFMSSVSHLVLIPFVTFYVMMDYDAYRLGLLSLIPKKRKPEVMELLGEIDKMLKKYIRGQLLVCLIIGSSVSIAMLLMGIPYALLIGAFAGLIDVIPYIGVILSLIPAVLFALMKSPLYAVFVLIVLYFIHWLEGHVIIPNIMGQSVNLPPLTVIVALIIGAEVMGLIGMFLAVPVAAVIRVVIEFYIKKRIERENADVV